VARGPEMNLARTVQSTHPIGPSQLAQTQETRFTMRAVTSSHLVEMEWTTATNTSPCPICGGDQGCKRHIDNTFASCAQQPSEWPLTDGGWLHRVAFELPRPVA
jgi:hypothetical protein